MKLRLNVNNNTEIEIFVKESRGELRPVGSDPSARTGQ